MGILRLPGQPQSAQPPSGYSQLDLRRVGLRAPIVVANLVGNDGYNIVTRQAASITGTTPTVGQLGLAGRSFVGNTLNRLEYPSSAAAQTKFTAMAVFVWRSGAANNFPQLCAGSTGNSGFRLAEPSNGPGGTLALTKGGVTSLAGLSLTTGVPYAVVTSHDQATGDYYILLRNLQTGAVTSATQNDTTVSTAGNGLAAIGNARGDFNGSWNGDIFACTMAFEYIARAQGEAWLRNPWQVFQAPQRVLTLAAAAGASAALAGSASAVSASTAVLSSGIPLSGNASAAASGNAALSAQIALAGTASAVVSANAAITTAIRLSSAATVAATATAALAGTTATLTGSAAAVSVGSGALSTAIALSGSGSATAAGSGALTAPGTGLSGSASCTALATGGLSTGIRLVGPGGAQVFATGQLTTAIRLAGSASAASAASGALPTSSAAPISIPSSRTVNFGGGTNRVDFDGGTNRVNF
ncbi:MAG TPA: hypothetical protein VFW00_07180 [Rhodocyclaceae bacterium]|nr:hypothetical protein [Rhodocyclaceae bacterium]